MMEIASAWLVLDEHRNVTKLKNITPAEAVHLNTIFKRHKDDLEPKVIGIEVVGQAKRTDGREKARLAAKFQKQDAKTGELELEKTWPGINPNFPQSFEDAGFTVGDGIPKTGKSLPYPSKDNEMLFANQLDEDIVFEKEEKKQRGEKEKPEKELVDA